MGKRTEQDSSKNPGFRALADLMRDVQDCVLSGIVHSGLAKKYEEEGLEFEPAEEEVIETFAQAVCNSGCLFGSRFKEYDSIRWNKFDMKPEIFALQGVKLIRSCVEAYFNTYLPERIQPYLPFEAKPSEKIEMKAQILGDVQDLLHDR